jgi:eukaryotic-like serine/threonine-protein kinase
MIKRTELGYTTKLIDFDSSYIVGSPPPPEEIVGTMNYYSPELISYIQGGAPGAVLTEASDIFALGLIYAEYLTGALPAFDPAHHEAAIAVLNGAELRLPPGDIPPPVVALVERMLLANPAARPTVAEVHAMLIGLRSGTPTVGRAPRPTEAPTPGRAPVRLGSPGPPAAPAPSAGPVAGPSPDPEPARSASRGSALRGKGLRIVADAGRPAPDAPPPGRARALLGKLLGKLGERGR